MKRYITFILFLVCTIITAQNINDIVRYGTENLQGTARFSAMGGAFGALGGDLSAININPAGSAVFNNSLFTFSTSIYNNDNSANYFGTHSNTSQTNIDLNQIGGVLVFKSGNSDSEWNKIAIAGNYDIVENFDNQIFIKGNSNQGIANYFLNFAEGVPFGSILLQENEFIEDAYLDIGSNQGFGDQQAFLGYYGGIIDPVALEDTNTEYTSNADYTSVNQNLISNTTGYNSKFTLNFASQYQKRWSFGTALNFHTVLFDRYDEFTETGYNSDSEIQRTTFDNLLHTQGSGFSFSLGAIAKLNEMVRIGGSYQSPTWYRLTDDLSQRISSDLEDSNINFINLDVVNLFPRYTLKTPSKYTGSAAFIFSKDGLISFDYSYQNMSRASLGPSTDANFSTVNGQASNTLRGVSTIRIGSEYRISRVSLRGGYRFEQSPYSNSNLYGNLNEISGGIGFNFGGNRLDFALSRTQRDISKTLFDTGLDTAARVNQVYTNATLSYTMSF